MANNTRRIVTPPGLATRILALAANAHDRSTVLGDLHEEFVQRSQSSTRKARAWYWQQVVLSTPYLIRQRMRLSAVFSVVATLVVTSLAFVLISLWDLYVARKTAQFLAQQIANPPLLVIRLLYFLVQLSGTAVVGAMVAHTLYFKDRKFSENTITRLLPTALLILAASVGTWVASGGNLPASYLALRVGLSIPALVLGARLVTNHAAH